ncbi:MAG: hypothetical protein IH597_08780 [Bacteroidales bacterium]|nr:hypothetical protein [Bacteroidales bacterium]
MNVDSLPKIKVYAVTRQPLEDELPGYRISSGHQDFIERMMMKYQISSEYPQHYLVKIGMSVSSKLVDMDSVPTHIFIQYFPQRGGFHYFSYPDTQDCIEWFGRFFENLVDIYSRNHHKRVHKTG